MKNNKFFYALYSPDGEKLLGIYNNISDIVINFYGIPKNNPGFSKKKKSLESIICRKKKISNPKKWIIFKMEL